MESIRDFDQFFEDLSKRIIADPKRKREILTELIARTQCPYLKSILTRMIHEHIALFGYK